MRSRTSARGLGLTVRSRTSARGLGLTVPGQTHAGGRALPARAVLNGAVLATSAAASLAGCLAAPGPAPSPVATPTPAKAPKATPEPTQGRWKTAALAGWVYDPRGQAVAAGHWVRVRTGPAARVTFDHQVEVSQGQYGLTSVPSLVELTMAVLRDGKPVVSRSVRFSGLEPRPSVSFGGPATVEDPDAPAFPVPAPGP